MKPRNFLTVKLLVLLTFACLNETYGSASQKAHPWDGIVPIDNLVPNGQDAQPRILKGYVTTFDSIPLINAEVMALSSKRKFYTDSLGNFEIQCMPKDKIKVSGHGFTSRRVKIKAENNYLLVNLKFKTNPESPEIAIGYGHIKDKDKLYAVSALNNNDLGFSQYSDIYDVLTGRFSGVSVVNGDIIIRGQNSLYGSSAALLVLDGVVVDKTTFEMIRPIEVKNISILKDGSSAIYGSRGASGVVIVELKKE